MLVNNGQLQWLSGDRLQPNYINIPHFINPLAIDLSLVELQGIPVAGLDKSRKVVHANISREGDAHPQFAYFI